MVRISVVLPCFNEAAFMHIALTSLNEQTRPYDELIICDNESTDNSIEVAKQYTSKIFTSFRGKLNALNVGVSMASGDIVFTVDSDCWYDPTYIERVTKHFENSGTVLVLSSVYNDDSSTFTNYVDALLNFIGYYLMKHGLGAGRAFRREAFMQVGGFNLNVNQLNVRSISSEEEISFHQRIARLGRIIYDPSIVFHHRRMRQVICESCQHQAEGVCEYCSEIQRKERF